MFVPIASVNSGGNVRLIALMPVFALAVTSAVAGAQETQPASPQSQSSAIGERPPTRAVASHTLARAAAFASMARPAHLAAPDALRAQRAATLAQRAQAAYTAAAAAFDAHSYVDADVAARRATRLAVDAIRTALGAELSETTVSGGDVVTAVPAPAVVPSTVVVFAVASSETRAALIAEARQQAALQAGLRYGPVEIPFGVEAAGPGVTPGGSLPFGVVPPVPEAAQY